MQIKKRITKYFLILSVSLLVINILIDLFSRGDKNKLPVSELTTNQIDSVFVFVLNEYGIEDRWISVKKAKVSYEDSLTKQFTVKLPADLPIPLIIKDVHRKIENDITGFVSEEKKIFGTTEIRIYTNEILKLKATLIPDSKTIRDRNKLSFIITDAMDLSVSSFNSFLSVPYNLSAGVVPSDANQPKADSLKKYSKEYVVIINDDMTDTKYKLETNARKELLKNSINNIRLNFGEANYYVIDETSKLFNSTVYNYVRDEFKKKGISLVKLNEFIRLQNNDESELTSRFKFHCNDIDSSKQKIFAVSFENFNKVRNDLEGFRKKGNQVLAVSSTEIKSQR